MTNRLNHAYGHRTLTLTSKYGVKQAFPLRQSIVGYVTSLEWKGRRLTFRLSRSKDSKLWTCYFIHGMEPLCRKPTMGQALAFGLLAADKGLGKMFADPYWNDKFSKRDNWFTPIAQAFK